MADESRKNVTLEAVRGCAALLVVAGHARYALYAANGLPLSGRSRFESALLFPTSFGRVSVAVFFVLSGYLVGGQVLRQWADGRFDGRIFFIKRFSRLWFVLAGGVAFTAALDWVSRQVFTNDVSRAQGRTTSSLPDLLCNLAFLQDGRCEAFGSNESLWSIGYEFNFYIVFALLVSCAYAVTAHQVIRIAMLSAGAMALVCGFGVKLVWFAPAWIIGAFLAAVQRKYGRYLMVACRRPSSIALGLGLAACGMLVSKFINRGDALIFLVTGILVSPFILISAIADPLPSNWTRHIIERVADIGEWSYTLYMFHLPVAWIIGVAVSNYSLPVNPFVVYVLFIILPIIVYPFFLAIEARTPRIRNWLLSATNPPSWRSRRRLG